MPRYKWTGGPNILGALDPGVQVSGGSNYTPTPGCFINTEKLDDSIVRFTRSCLS